MSVGAGRRRRSWFAAIAPAVFAILIAGQNVPNPLLPVYERELGLGALGVAIVFATYFVTLIPTLLVMARPSAQRHPVAALIAATVAAIAADVAFLTGSLAGLLAGRALIGVAIGLGTGAAAAITVALLGDRGRTVAATGNNIGAVSGTLLGASAAELSGGMTLGYTVHGGFLLVALALVILALTRTDLERPAPEVAPPPAAPRPTTGGTSVAFAAGALSWSCAGVLVAFLPAVIGLRAGSDSVLLGSAGVLLMLASAAVGQFALDRPSARQTLLWSIALIAAGLAALTAGVVAGQLWIVLAGCVIAGAGQGSGYRSGLRLLSRGLDPAAQGARASAYACVAYAAAVATVVLAGALGSSLDTVDGVTVTATAIVVLAVGVGLAARRIPDDAAKA